MTEEQILKDKMLRLEALFFGAATPGEQTAAGNALERLRSRLEELRRNNPETPFQFSLHDPWSRRLFLALARRYGLTPYRQYRQKYTSVMIKAPRVFIEETFWPEFQELDKELRRYLEQVTDKLIRANIYNDTSDAETCNEPEQLI